MSRLLGFCCCRSFDRGERKAKCMEAVEVEGKELASSGSESKAGKRKQRAWEASDDEDDDGATAPMEKLKALLLGGWGMVAAPAAAAAVDPPRRWRRWCSKQKPTNSRG